MANDTKPKVERTWIDEKFRTPVGELGYSAIAEPDSYKGEDPKYKITLQFDNDDPEFTKFKDRLDKVEQDYVENTAKKKWKSGANWKDGSTWDPDAKERRDDDTKTRISMTMYPDEAEDGSPCWPKGFLGCYDLAKNKVKPPNAGDKVIVCFSAAGVKTNMKTGLKLYPRMVIVVERCGRSGGGNVGTSDDWFAMVPAAKPMAAAKKVDDDADVPY